MPQPAPSVTEPVHRAALAQYRRRAAVYDLELAMFEPIRHRAVERLALARGATVIDAGCGTGLSLPLLQAAVGARGRVIGIEQCPEMLAKARAAAARHGGCGGGRVELIEAPVEIAPLAGRLARPADAALFHFTHDILRSPAALANVFAALRPGARVVACGLQWASPWLWPVNLFVFGAALHSVSSLAGLERPWRGLEQRLAGIELEPWLGGGVFLLAGRRP